MSLAKTKKNSKKYQKKEGKQRKISSSLAQETTALQPSIKTAT